MEGFKIDNNGDVVIEEGKIQTVNDTELITQTVRQVLKTNLGEWWLNKNEGIDFDCLLCKKPNPDQVEDNVLLGLRQIDETFRLTSFNCYTEERNFVVEFTAVNDNGLTIEIRL